MNIRFINCYIAIEVNIIINLINFTFSIYFYLVSFHLLVTAGFFGLVPTRLRWGIDSLSAVSRTVRLLMPHLRQLGTSPTKPATTSTQKLTR